MLATKKSTIHRRARAAISGRFHIEKRRYARSSCMTDADATADHIRTLLLMSSSAT